MIGESDGDLTPVVPRDQDEPERSGSAVDLEIIRQIELGEAIMDEYGETFSALAKPR